MPVDFSDLLNTFELVSMSPGEHEGVVCRRTGKIYVRSPFSDENVDVVGGELPDDIDDEEKYVVLPDKRDFDLGNRLTLGFAREHLPDSFDEVRYIFSKKGAYQKFKVLLAQKKALDRWYAFEAEATERALREWCEDNELAVAD